MRLAHIIEQVCARPWLIKPEAHAAIRDLLERKLDAELREPGIDICGQAVEVPEMTVEDGIARIPIAGIIGQKLTGMERGMGACDVNDVMQEVEIAMEDDEVMAIMFDIDSPGGTVSGIPEISELIAGMRGEKPIGAYTNGMIASAAYWIASSADMVFATRSSEIGSIGVYLPVYDESAAYEQAGIKVELIKAGKLKGAGFPGTSLTSDQRKSLQAGVNEIYSMFTSHVSMMRDNRISEDDMQGQTFMAEAASGRGLVDHLVRDYDEAVDLLVNG